MTLQRMPDFFVIGSPRCGTTALSKYLAAHDRICFSRPKEPHYFSGLGRGGEVPTGDVQTDYLDRFFAHYDEGFDVVGEGSVSYLYAPGAVARILELNPDALFISNVRNPLKMAQSFHARMLFTLDEDEESFETAWFLQERRARGECLPERCRDSRLLQYADLCRLGEQIERLFDAGGRERCLVNVYDDLAADPLAVYKRSLAFLGVPYDGRTVFPRKRPSRSYRYRWLQGLIHQTPPGAAKFVSSLDSKKGRKRKKGSLARQLRARLSRFNTVQKSLPPLEGRMRETLRDAFAPDIEKLGSLLGRDLGHWK